MLKFRRAQLTIQRNGLPAGEKLQPPKDILGALVASQMEAEDEAKLGKGEGKIAGLTDKEIIGNTCELQYHLSLVLASSLQYQKSSSSCMPWPMYLSSDG